MEQTAADLKPALHAAGVRPDDAAPFRLEIHEFEDFVAVVGAPRLPEALQSAMKRQVLRARDILVECGVLKDDAEAVSDCDRPFANVVTIRGRESVCQPDQVARVL